MFSFVREYLRVIETSNVISHDDSTRHLQGEQKMRGKVTLNMILQEHFCGCHNKKREQNRLEHFLKLRNHSGLIDPSELADGRGKISLFSFKIRKLIFPFNFMQFIRVKLILETQSRLQKNIFCHLFF